VRTLAPVTAIVPAPVRAIDVLRTLDVLTVTVAAPTSAIDVVRTEAPVTVTVDAATIVIDVVSADVPESVTVAAPTRAVSATAGGSNAWMSGLNGCDRPRRAIYLRDRDVERTRGECRRRITVVDRLVRRDRTPDEQVASRGGVEDAKRHNGAPVC
jgi:hypothetical protein